MICQKHIFTISTSKISNVALRLEKIWFGVRYQFVHSKKAICLKKIQEKLFVLKIFKFLQKWRILLREQDAEFLDEKLKAMKTWLNDFWRRRVGKWKALSGFGFRYLVAIGFYLVVSARWVDSFVSQCCKTLMLSIKAGVFSVTN